MDIEVFVLCDAATADIANKLNVLGVFDTIGAMAFPAIHPQCAIAARLRFRYDEKGTHSVTIKLTNEQGIAIAPAFNADFNIVFPEAAVTISHNIIVSIAALKLEKPGEYSIELSVDGNNNSRIPFFVRNAPK